MGIATLIIFIVIILVATIAAVIIIQATNVAKNQAQGASEESQNNLGKRLVADHMYLFIDQNIQSPHYKEAIAFWLRAHVPDYGSVVDLRKTLMTVETPDGVYFAKYIDADGDEIFGDNACDTKNPYPRTGTNENAGDVDYNAMQHGDYFTCVWLDCDGKNEDYLVYPGQLVMLIYVNYDHPLHSGDRVKVTLTVQGGGTYIVETKLPTFTDAQVIDIPVYAFYSPAPIIF
jgi:archaellin